MPQSQQIISIVPSEMAQQRLDQVLASLYPQYSRSQLQKWIKAGQVRVDDKVLKPKERLTGGEELIVMVTQEKQTHYEPEAMALDIIYEDEAILVLNKPVGQVVHPAVGNWSGTLVNGLLYYRAAQDQLPRAGIVHRLDKDTSGLMVVAKTLEAHQSLVAQLQARTVSREYLALVSRAVIAGNTLTSNMGRHPVDRKKMAVTVAGKTAITHYRVERRFTHHTLLSVKLETGRTHQIRVHLSWKQMPIVGDATYGGRPRIPAGISATLRAALLAFPRQALHATRLGLLHPTSAAAMQWAVDLPVDMQNLLQQLQAEEVDA